MSIFDFTGYWRIVFQNDCIGVYIYIFKGFPGGSVVKNSPVKARNTDSIPRSGRSPGGGNRNPLQCSCPGNPVDRGAWWATVHGIAKELDMT